VVGDIMSIIAREASVSMHMMCLCNKPDSFCLHAGYCIPVAL